MWSIGAVDVRVSDGSLVQIVKKTVAQPHSTLYLHELRNRDLTGNPRCATPLKSNLAGVRLPPIYIPSSILCNDR